MGPTSHPPVGKARILETAERLFLKHGYRAVSIRDIANACGVTNAALYYYFPSKEALFWEVLRQHLDRLAENLRAARTAAPPNPQAQLTAMTQVYAEWVLNRRASIFALRRDMLAMKRQTSHHKHKPFYDLALTISRPFEEVLQEAVQKGVLRQPPLEAPLSSMLLGLLHGILHSQENVANPEALAKAAARWAVETFWHGMAASDTPSSPGGTP